MAPKRSLNRSPTKTAATTTPVRASATEMEVNPNHVVVYTEEEEALLRRVLDSPSGLVDYATVPAAPSPGTSPRAAAAGSPEAAGAAVTSRSGSPASLPTVASATSPSWSSRALPLLVSMTRKVLAWAQESYAKHEAEDQAASSTRSAITAVHDDAKRSAKTSAQLVEEFGEESSYIVGQLELLQSGPFFTIQRLCEILADPQRHHMTTAAGPTGRVLRAEKLQTTIRRCVLVTVTNGPANATPV